MNRRLWILGLLATLTLASYAALRHYSPALVAYVVEQTLIQKAPDNVDPSEVRARFGAWLETIPQGSARLERLFALSQQLEKVQKLRTAELNRLLTQETGSLPTP